MKPAQNSIVTEMAMSPNQPSILLDQGIRDLHGASGCSAPVSTTRVGKYGEPDRRRKFMEAARSGDKDVINALLENKDTSIRAQDITQALRVASGGGHDGVVGVLLDAGADINADPPPCRAEMNIISDYDDWTADRANPVMCGQRTCSVNVCGRTALQAAAGSGHTKVVSTLLHAGAKINAPASRYHGRTALQAAAAEGHAQLVSYLLEVGADPNAEPSEYYGRTALQAAAESGHVEVVSILLRADADISADPSPNYGRTALQAAAERGHAEIVSRLVEAGADVNAKPSSNLHHGRTALQAAAGGGYTRIVLTLLEAEADINAAASRCNGRTALQAAAEGGHAEIVMILVAAGADINAEPCLKYGRTALQAAAGGGHTAIIWILRDAGADINAEPSPNHGRTTLQAAAEGGHTETVSILLGAGAEIDAEPSANYGRTALQAAAGSGHAQIVSTLLSFGADINAKPSADHGRTALQAAAEGGHAGIVSILLRAGANVDPDLLLKHGRTALQAAAGGGHTEIVLALLKAGANVNAKPSSNLHHGRTALQAAAGGGYSRIVSILLNAGANIDAPASRCHGKTALQAAAAIGHIETVSVLLDAGANTNIEPSAYCGRTALQAAAEGGYAEVLSILIAAGAWINAEPSPSDGRTALQAAAEGGHAKIVSILLHAGAKVNASPSSNHGRTALQAAAEAGHTDIVSALLAMGADINAPPSQSHGRTALQAAVQGGHAEIVSTLLEAGADINAEPSYYHGRTALQAAAAGGYVGIVSKLLNAGAKVNANPSENCGRTALQAAAEAGHVALVLTLLDEGADISAPPAKYSGRTVLQAAASKGHRKVMQILLNHARPDQNLRRRSSVGGRRRLTKILSDSPRLDQSVLRAAAEGGYTNMVEFLLDSGLEVGATDSDGTTCLKWANSYPEVVKLLLERGANVISQDITGATPLHWSARGNSVKSLLLLIDAGADTEAQDYEDRKPLDILLDQLEMPSMQLVRPLLRNGPSIRGRTAADWRKALRAGNEEIVMITETPVGVKSSIDICRIKRDSAHILKVNQNPSTVKTLYSATGLPTLSDAIKFFPGCDPHELDWLANPSVVQWFWSLEQQSRFFGMPPRPAVHGTGLPSHIGKLATTVDTQALLTCYVRFEFLIHEPNTEPDTAPRPRKPTAGKQFKTRAEKTEISWTMRRPPSNLDGNSDTGSKSNPIFRSTDYRSTLDIGWIPDNGIDFFSIFLLDLQKKWRALLQKALEHLAINRMSILENGGRTADFIDNLLRDEKQWMIFRALLDDHMQKARSLLQDFKDHRYLFEEAMEYRKDQKGRAMSFESKAINDLSKIIEDFEFEVGEVIENLDLKKHEMIQLEFNLVNIYEARTSKMMGMSMRRLSWITFVFLPLMFVASLFGMNVDLINGGPRWWWVIVLSVGLFVVVLSVWSLLKLIRIEEELPENNVRAAIAGNLRALSVDLRRDWLDTIRRPYDNPESKGLGYDWRAVRRRQSDLESGRPNEPRSFHIPPAMKSKFQ